MPGFLAANQTNRWLQQTSLCHNGPAHITDVNSLPMQIFFFTGLTKQGYTWDGSSKAEPVRLMENS